MSRPLCICRVWAISAVLQTALTTSLLINDLTAYSSASPRDLLLNAQPSAVIGALVNTTSMDYASFCKPAADAIAVPPPPCYRSSTLVVFGAPHPVTYGRSNCPVVECA